MPAMQWLKGLGATVYRLFVEDSSFAAEIVLWMLILGWLLPRSTIPDWWRGGILFVGLIAILVESVLRRARQR
ncbi:MAG TPA: hypothetical protein VK695_06730 [Steroidobacteraceae bacterium]|nr:hypothetical protein [Steroidobacteraceae bacterium]